MSRTLTLYIAMSLDGYIAGLDDDIRFLNSMEREGEDYGYAAFVQTIDTVIWGRRTFDKVLSFGGDLPYKDKSVYVISRSRTGSHEHIRYHSDVVSLVKGLKGQEGAGIYCDGGGQIVTELQRAGLIDRYIISIVPYLLGGGVRLFQDAFSPRHLIFRRSVSFPSGLVQLWYERK
ncbi:dihydrofolate reductase family protein [Roseivirga sp. BDSF3-8]|uniref:dihydrofolate reductase family protein n=1 Tax=Roseivirga sp. BDSF3-8 TaxID=3241598 RepID=UPI003531B379